MLSAFQVFAMLFSKNEWLKLTFESKNARMSFFGLTIIFPGIN